MRPRFDETLIRALEGQWEGGSDLDRLLEAAEFEQVEDGRLPLRGTALSSFGSSLLRSLAGFAASIAWRGGR